MESDLCTLTFRLLLLIWSGTYYLSSAASLETRAAEIQQRLQKLEIIADRLKQIKSVLASVEENSMENTYRYEISRFLKDKSPGPYAPQELEKRGPAPPNDVFSAARGKRLASWFRFLDPYRGFYDVRDIYGGGTGFYTPYHQLTKKYNNPPTGFSMARGRRTTMTGLTGKRNKGFRSLIRNN